MRVIRVSRDVNTISSGSCAVGFEGRLKCWGDSEINGYFDSNNRGDSANEMGNFLPYVDFGNRSVSNFSTSDRVSCAVLETRDLMCWGFPDFGQLGIGEIPSSPGIYGPVDLGSQRHAVDVYVGQSTTCALLNTSRIKCWGSNQHGILGQEDTMSRGVAPGQMGDNLPEIDLGSNRTVIKITLGEFHICAILDNGKVKCWGDNSKAQLGIGETKAELGSASNDMGDALPYVDFGCSTTVVDISASRETTCAILHDGRLVCWGRGTFGENGNGLPSNEIIGDYFREMGDGLVSVDLGWNRSAVSICSGFEYHCALLQNGGVKCWGRNQHGQLGQDDEMNRGSTPSPTVGDLGDSLPELNLGRSAVSVHCGSEFACALLDDSTLKCWGRNNVGQLGYGDTDSRGKAPGVFGMASLSTVDLGFATGSPTTSQPISLSPSTTNPTPIHPTPVPTSNNPFTVAPSQTTTNPGTKAPLTSPSPTLAPESTAPSSRVPTVSSVQPTSSSPWTNLPTTATPNTFHPASASPSTPVPLTSNPATVSPRTPNPQTTSPHTTSPQTTSPQTTSPQTTSPQTLSPKTTSPTTASPNSMSPATRSPTSSSPTTFSPQSLDPTSNSPTTPQPASQSPDSQGPISRYPTTVSPNTAGPKTQSPISLAPTSGTPSNRPTSRSPVSQAPTSTHPASMSPQTQAPSTSNHAPTFPTGLPSASPSNAPTFPTGSPSLGGNLGGFYDQRLSDTITEMNVETIFEDQMCGRDLEDAVMGVFRIASGVPNTTSYCTPGSAILTSSINPSPHPQDQANASRFFWLAIRAELTPALLFSENHGFDIPRWGLPNSVRIKNIQRSQDDQVCREQGSNVALVMVGSGVIVVAFILAAIALWCCVRRWNREARELRSKSIAPFKAAISMVDFDRDKRGSVVPMGGAFDIFRKLRDQNPREWLTTIHSFLLKVRMDGLSRREILKVEIVWKQRLMHFMLHKLLRLHDILVSRSIAAHRDKHGRSLPPYLREQAFINIMLILVELDSHHFSPDSQPIEANSSQRCSDLKSYPFERSIAIIENALEAAHMEHRLSFQYFYLKMVANRLFISFTKGVHRPTSFAHRLWAEFESILSLVFGLIFSKKHYTDTDYAFLLLAGSEDFLAHDLGSEVFKMLDSKLVRTLIRKNGTTRETFSSGGKPVRISRSTLKVERKRVAIFEIYRDVFKSLALFMQQARAQVGILRKQHMFQKTRNLLRDDQKSTFHVIEQGPENLVHLFTSRLARHSRFKHTTPEALRRGLKLSVEHLEYSALSMAEKIAEAQRPYRQRLGSAHPAAAGRSAWKKQRLVHLEQHQVAEVARHLKPTGHAHSQDLKFGGSFERYRAELSGVPVDIVVLGANIRDDHAKGLRVHQSLTHSPNIVRFFGIGHAQGKGWFVAFEHIENSLSDIYTTQAFSLLAFHHRAKMCMQLASALHYLHSKHRVSHGQICPDNILVAGLQVKLTNFQFSRELSSKILHTQPTQSAFHFSSMTEYLAPEQTANNSKLSDVELKWIDVFSFGLVAAELLQQPKDSKVVRVSHLRSPAFDAASSFRRQGRTDAEINIAAFELKPELKEVVQDCIILNSAKRRLAVIKAGESKAASPEPMANVAEKLEKSIRKAGKSHLQENKHNPSGLRLSREKQIAINSQLTVQNQRFGGRIFKVKVGEIAMAVKRLRQLGSGKADMKEVMIHDLALKGNEHVVRILGHGFHSESHGPYLCLEWIEKSLDSLIYMQNQLPEQILLQMSQSLARGFGRMHDDNLVHRDIKPKNILVTSNFNIKICDFGVSDVVRDDNDAKSHRIASRVASGPGTFPYMAPELFAGSELADVGHNPTSHRPLSRSEALKKQDSYSLGATILEMFGGLPIRMFEEYSDESKIMARHRQGETATFDFVKPTFLKRRNVPHDIVQLVTNCIAFHPAQRPTMGMIKAAIDPILLFDFPDHCSSDDMAASTAPLPSSLDQDISQPLLPTSAYKSSDDKEHKGLAATITINSPGGYDREISLSSSKRLMSSNLLAQRGSSSFYKSSLAINIDQECEK
ncbi:hypothetical protein AAMO2058_001554600 [Amorphochlora amoebiformis]